MRSNKFPLLIGITGNIGSGKSTFCNCLQEKGLTVINADQIANQCLTSPEVICALVQRYSKSILITGDRGEADQISRSALAEKVFGNSQETRFLNSLIHPLVLKEFQRLAEESSEPYLAYEVPLLFEADLQACFDYLILVYAPWETRLERLKIRGESETDALLRQHHQLPDEEKLARVDLVVSNDFDSQALCGEAERFIKLLPDLKQRTRQPFTAT